MTDSSDDVLARSSALIERARANRAGGGPARPATRRRTSGRQSVAKRLARIAIVDAGILVLAVAIGFVVPLGLFGALAVMALLLAATLTLSVWPADDRRAIPAEALRTADIRALPAQTERWLDAQRPALPAPAMTLVDQIGVRLETLAPQLAQLEPGAPAAEEVRKLIGEQLPDFVRGYQRVPDALRQVPRNGKTPDSELMDGLRVIEREIGQMTEQLAQGDLDSLSTRGRFLELKYRGDEAGDA
jgi:hypothetical protein